MAALRTWRGWRPNAPTARDVRTGGISDLSQVIACATVNAARVFEAFDDRGTLNIGAPADVAVLELRNGTFEFIDNYNNKRNGTQRLFPVATVLGGKRSPARA